MDDFLHGPLPLALVLEPNENHTHVGLTRAGKGRRHHGAKRLHLRHGGDDFLRLLQLAIGKFARRAVRREDNAEHPALVFQRQKILLERFVSEKHGSHRADCDHQHKNAMLQRPAQAVEVRIRNPVEAALKPIEQGAVLHTRNRPKDARGHRG